MENGTDSWRNSLLEMNRSPHWRIGFLLLSVLSLATAVWAQVGAGTSGRDPKAPKAPDRKSGGSRVGESDAYDFSVPKYKDNQLRSKIMGRNAVTYNGIATLKQVHVETYTYANGKPVVDMIVESPAGVYDMDKGVFTSKEAVKARKADGSFTIAGLGFEYRQNDLHLTISNNCHTTFLLNSKSTPAPRTQP